MKFRRILLPAALLVAAAVLVTGCTSISYKTVPTYVGFSSEGVKSVKQAKKTSYDDDELLRTFDDEFVYDEEGNVIRHIQTQYFDAANKFDEYEITYQKINGRVLPKSAAINGVVYLEVEYDLLPTDHEGHIPAYTSAPVFNRQIYDFLLFEENNTRWKMDLSNFDVPFRIDGEFVKAEESFDYYSGFDNDSVLTTGFDNILLQRFYYSREKFNEGYNKTVDPMLTFLAGVEDTANLDTTFTFDWDVEADKLIQTGLTVVESFSDDFVMNFKVDRDFDSSARLTREVWTVSDTKNGLDNPKTLFEQELSY